MRTIKLLQWLHRSGAAQNDTRPTTYRLTIISLSAMLNTIRKQLHYELQALDVSISRMHVSYAEAEHLASTSITVECPPHLRSRLNALALRLGKSPDIRRIHVESAAKNAIHTCPEDRQRKIECCPAPSFATIVGVGATRTAMLL